MTVGEWGHNPESAYFDIMEPFVKSTNNDIPTRVVPHCFNSIFLPVVMHYNHINTMLLPHVFLPILYSPTDNPKHLWEEVTVGVVDCQLPIGLWTHLVFMSNILCKPEQETSILQLIPYV